MTRVLPEHITLLDGRRFKVVKVHHRMTREAWRVEWFDERPKGCLAEIVGDEFRESGKEAA